MSAASAVISDILGPHHDVGFGSGMVMLLGMFFFWGLVIFEVIALFRGGLGGASRDSNDPGEVLKRRLAAGEISVEEYGRRKTLIEGGAAGAAPPGEPAPGSG